MSTSIFPIVASAAETGDAAAGKPVYREVKWDYTNNRPVFENGEPVIVTGAEAVMVWAWNALHVERYRFEALSRSYGCEINELIGRPYTDALKNSEAVRYVKECLLINPYISSVDNVSINFDSGTLRISFALTTIYGEVGADVVL